MMCGGFSYFTALMNNYSKKIFQNGNGGCSGLYVSDAHSGLYKDGLENVKHYEKL